MELYAYPRTLRDILNLKRKYIIPRFQREYSWGIDELTVLWNDMFSNMEYDGNTLHTSEHFIGSLVLVGDDTTGTEFLIVDGQQRLTTITIFFAALVETFKTIGKHSLMKASQKYIENVDDDDEEFLILMNESPKPFFQFRIQQLEKDLRYKPQTDEEKNLLNAYQFFLDKLSATNLKKEVSRRYKMGSLDHVEVLKTLRQQVLSFKTIYITVKEEDDAYLIFETLNAKGKDLESIDLIKNLIFKKIRTNAAGDYAKEVWRDTRNILFSKEEKISMSQFYRHFWLSKYSFTRDAGLYEDFKKRINDDEASYKEFLDNLNDAAKVYVSFANPQPSDWKLVEERFIYATLSALKIFEVSQPRPLLLALIEKRRANQIKFEDLKKVFIAMENFHFIFTAISSSRASNIEGKYSTFARQIRNCNTKKDVNDVVKEIISYYQNNISQFDVFEKNFISLYYTKSVTTDKRLIQYILRKIELSYHQTEELTTNIISIEHVLSESSSLEEVGRIGNLIPLDKSLNSSIGDVSFTQKISMYGDSDLLSVKNFVEKYKEYSNWTINDIEERSKDLAKLSYYTVWKI